MCHVYASRLVLVGVGMNWFAVKAEREFPEEFEARETDKLHYRYPEGERWGNERAGVQCL